MKKTRKIIEIDETLCNGCGECVTVCVENAIQIVDGKAKLISDRYCDGLGNCIGECPTGALTIVEREADDYDEAAVQALQQQKMAAGKIVYHDMPCGCPGTQIQDRRQITAKGDCCEKQTARESALRQWPIQIHLVPPHAPFLQGADLLIAADCCAFAYADFHQDFLRNRTVLIGCPKLDDAEAYVERLRDIFLESGINSITVLRMEVPCCMGITHIAQQALQASKKKIPFAEIVISTDGRLL